MYFTPLPQGKWFCFLTGRSFFFTGCNKLLVNINAKWRFVDHKWELPRIIFLSVFYALCFLGLCGEFLLFGPMLFCRIFFHCCLWCTIIVGCPCVRATERQNQTFIHTLLVHWRLTSIIISLASRWMILPFAVLAIVSFSVYNTKEP
jgi:hypothetical protein